MQQKDKYTCCICNKKFKKTDSIVSLECNYFVHDNDKKRDCLTVALLELTTHNFISYEELEEWED